VPGLSHITLRVLNATQLLEQLLEAKETCSKIEEEDFEAYLYHQASSKHDI